MLRGLVLGKSDGKRIVRESGSDHRLITGPGLAVGPRDGPAGAPKLALLDLPTANWEGVKEELTKLGAASVYTGCTDVTKLPEVEQAVSQATTACGPIDVLIANAGVGLSTSDNRSISKHSRGR